MLVLYIRHFCFLFLKNPLYFSNIILGLNLILSQNLLSLIALSIVFPTPIVDLRRVRVLSEHEGQIHACLLQIASEGIQRLPFVTPLPMNRKPLRAARRGSPRGYVSPRKQTIYNNLMCAGALYKPSPHTLLRPPVNLRW